MVWSRLIIVDRGRTQVYDVNGGRVVVASLRSVLRGAVRGMVFDEVEWAASEFVDVGSNVAIRDGDDVVLLGYYHPRRFLSVYVDEGGDVRSVLNSGLRLGSWLKYNVVLELDGLREVILNEAGY